MAFSIRKIVDYTLLFLTIAISGFPFFSSTILLIPIFLILFTVFLLRKKRFDKVFLIAIFLLAFITILQTFIFNFFSIQTSTGVFLRIVNGYLLVKILKENFANYYVNIFYVLSLISLFIFIPIILVPGLGNSLVQASSIFQILNIAGYDGNSLIVYTLHNLTLNRNSGPFWEAGAFGGYLVLAFILNYFLTFKRNKTKGMVILLTILSTLSSTAYFSVFFFLFIFYFKKIKNFFLKIVAIILLGSVSLFATFNLPFLSEKVINQVQQAAVINNPYADTNNSARFFSMLRDYKDLKGHEFFGRGSNPVTRYSFDHENQIRTVGITDIIVRMGVPYFLFMMFILHRSLRSFTYFYYFKEKLYYNGLFATILLTLMSQVYFNFPIYWSFLFLSCAYKKKST